MRSVAALPWHDQPLHRHADARLIVFTGGELEEQSFGGVGRFKAGEILFRPAWYAHADCAREAGASYLRLPLSTGAVSRWIALHGWRAGRGRVDLDRLPHGDEVLTAASKDPYPDARRPTPLREACAMLASADAPRVAQVARRLGFEPYVFCRRFKAEIGLSPSQFRRQARLQRALGLLFEGAGSLARVASDAGFHDQSHFTMELKRETGRTPRQLAAENAC